MSRVARARAVAVAVLAGSVTLTTAPAQAASSPTGSKSSAHSVETQASLDATKASSVAIVALTIWGQPKFDGKNVHFWANSTTCTPDSVRPFRNLRHYSFALPKGQNWNNRISSIEVHKGCQVKLFAQKNFKGHHTKWLGTTKRLGRVPDPGDNWNNAATSIKFRRK